MKVDPALLDAIYSEDIFFIQPSPVIILDKPWGNVTASEISLLEKILAAIKQSLNTVKVLHQPTLNLSLLTAKPAYAIFFGQATKGIPNYEVVEANNTKLVASDSLSALAASEDSRKKLWQALKKQFSI